jgi:hypothetical protein
LFAALHYRRGLHLVIPGGEHVYIQRSSDKVVTTAFTEGLGEARLIESDDLFNAALVSFGSFGLIHGLVIETEPLYRQEQQARQMGYQSVKDVLTSLNVASLGFEGVDGLPYHFQVYINPFKLKSRNKGAFVKILKKIPLSADEIEEFKLSVSTYKPPDEGTAFTNRLSNSLVKVLAVLTSLTAKLLPKRIVYSFAAQVALVSRVSLKEPETKFPSEWFTSPDAPKDVISTIGFEVAVPLEKLQDTLELYWPCNPRTNPRSY